MLPSIVILCLVPVAVLIGSVMSFEKEMTISIDPRKEECFYQPVKRGQLIDLEYQVSTYHSHFIPLHYYCIGRRLALCRLKLIYSSVCKLFQK